MAKVSPVDEGTPPKTQQPTSEDEDPPPQPDPQLLAQQPSPVVEGPPPQYVQPTAQQPTQMVQGPPPQYGPQYGQQMMPLPPSHVQGPPPQYGGQYGQPMMQQPIFQQPGHHTTVVVANMGGTQTAEGPRPWRSGICGCFDDCSSCAIVCGLCAAGLLTGFPCCMEFYGCSLAMRMDESCCLCCCVPGYLTALRTKLRVENNIQGKICDDCCLTTCCRPCVMCQMSRELDYLR